MFQVLNVAIGLTFVFLLFSLVVAALNEIWLSFLDKRAAFLEEGLHELLQDRTEGAPISASEVLQHGLIASLSRGRFNPADTGTTGVPSYMPGKSFVLALLSLLAQRNTAVTALEQQIASLPESRLKETLLALYTDAGQNTDHFKANLENWFNQTMDRVGGWYKRYAQQWLFALGFACAFACNVDAIRIIGALSTDPQLRQHLAQQGIDYVGARGTNPPAAPAPPAAVPAPPGGTAVISPSASSPPPSGSVEPGAASSRSGRLLDEQVRRVEERLTALGATGIPLGWSGDTAAHLFRDPQTASNPSGAQLFGRWLAALAGWLVTALAASLGAPFWFDLLNRFVDLRGVGRAPEEKDPTAPKKKPTGVESYLTTEHPDASGR